MVVYQHVVDQDPPRVSQDVKGFMSTVPNRFGEPLVKSEVAPTAAPASDGPSSASAPDGTAASSPAPAAVDGWTDIEHVDTTFGGTGRPDAKIKELQGILKRAEKALSDYESNADDESVDMATAVTQLKGMREALEALLDDFTSRCRRRDRALDDADDAQQGLAWSSSAEVVMHERDRDTDTEDDEDDKDSEPTRLLVRTGGELGQQIGSQMAQQLKQLGRVHAEAQEVLQTQIRELVQRVTSLAGNMESRYGSAARSLERAQADGIALTEELANLENEIRRMRARQKKHETVSKMQGMMRASRGNNAAELQQLLLEERAKTERLESSIVAMQETFDEQQARVVSTLNDEISAKERLGGRVAELSGELEAERARAAQLDSAVAEARAQTAKAEERVKRLQQVHAYTHTWAHACIRTC